MYISSQTKYLLIKVCEFIDILENKSLEHKVELFHKLISENSERER